VGGALIKMARMAGKSGGLRERSIRLPMVVCQSLRAQKKKRATPLTLARAERWKRWHFGWDDRKDRWLDSW
jgi:hypothetical protein